MILSKQKVGEVLSLYLAISEAAVSAVLIRIKANVELLVFYVTQSLLDSETRYSEVEKIALALVVEAQKLRSFFQSQSIVVLTKTQLQCFLLNPKCFGRLVKCTIELSEFNIDYKPRTAIKGQMVVDFILEFTCSSSVLSKMNLDELEWSFPTWKFFVDRSMSQEGSGIGIVLESPTQEKISKTFKLDFLVSNNEAEYESFLTGLRLAKDLDVNFI